jgi:hypothetical protein
LILFLVCEDEQSKFPDWDKTTRRCRDDPNPRIVGASDVKAPRHRGNITTPDKLRLNVNVNDIIIQSSNTDILRRRRRHVPPSLHHSHFSLPRPWLLVAAGLSLPSDKASRSTFGFLFHFLSTEPSLLACSSRSSTFRPSAAAASHSLNNSLL